MPKLTIFALRRASFISSRVFALKTARGRARVDVFVLSEGFEHHLVSGDVRQQAQLDLRIVGREQNVPVGGDERAADAAAHLGADRDVL